MEMLLLCKFLISLMKLGAFFFEWLFKSLPLDDQLLKAATFEQRANADPLHAEFFVNRCALSLFTTLTLDDPYSQYNFI